jgi:phosphoesterase RecJ-like protein
MTAGEIITASSACDILAGLDRAVICTHVRPDGDTVGSAVALTRLLRSMGKEARIACADPIPARLGFITEGEEVLDGDAAALLWQGGWQAVSIDVASPSQLGSLAERLPQQVLTLDHHALGQPFAPTYRDTEAASASEVLYGLILILRERGLARLTKELAAPLYAALSSDTGGFRFSNCRADSHRMAAELIGLGIDSAEINRLLFDSKSPEQIRAEGFVASALTSLPEGISYAAVTLADLDRLGILAEHLETAIDVVRSVAGTSVAFVAKEIEKNKFRISLRSVGLDVASVAAELGGGGHVRAAGCTVVAPSAEAAVDTVLQKIKERA